MNKIYAVLFAILFIVGCGVLDSGEDEIEKEEFIPFTEINSVTFSENEALITATIAKPNPCWQYVSTNILLNNGKYFFAARGFYRGGNCTQQIVEEQVRFNVRLQPYSEISFNFLNYNNVYIDTLIVPGN